MATLYERDQGTVNFTNFNNVRSEFLGKGLTRRQRLTEIDGRKTGRGLPRRLTFGACTSDAYSDNLSQAAIHPKRRFIPSGDSPQAAIHPKRQFVLF